MICPPRVTSRTCICSGAAVQFQRGCPMNCSMGHGEMEELLAEKTYRCKTCELVVAKWTCTDGHANESKILGRLASKPPVLLPCNKWGCSSGGKYLGNLATPR